MLKSLDVANAYHDAKLVINSHASYRTELQVLLTSLLSVEWHAWGEVLICLGASSADGCAAYNAGVPSPVCKVPLHDLMPSWFSNSSSFFNRELVVIHTERNGYDYTALSLLWEHRSHALVQARSYFYLPDTTFVDGRFKHAFHYYNSLAQNHSTVISAPLANSNAGMIFSRDVVDTYGDVYSRGFDKTEAVALEFDHLHCPEQSGNSSGSSSACPRHLTRYATSVIWLQRKERVGLVEAYGNGKVLKHDLFAELGVHKLVGFGEGGKKMADFCATQNATRRTSWPAVGDVRFSVNNFTQHEHQHAQQQDRRIISNAVNLIPHDATLGCTHY